MRLTLTFVCLLQLVRAKMHMRYECATSWFKFRQYCFRVFDDVEPLSWMAAEHFCKADCPLDPTGHPMGSLAILNTKEKNDFIIAQVMNSQFKRAWIGASDAKEEGKWLWVGHEATNFNETEVVFSNWKIHEPNNKWGAEHCAEINRGRLGHWNDIKCQRRLPFICQYENKRPYRGNNGKMETMEKEETEMDPL